MRLIESVFNYFETKRNMLIAQQNLQISYGNIGMQLYHILSQGDYPYLDRYLDFTEICACFNGCTSQQLVYALKLHRDMTEDECNFLSKRIGRELSKTWNMPYADFGKRYRVSVINGNLFLGAK